MSIPTKGWKVTMYFIFINSLVRENIVTIHTMEIKNNINYEPSALDAKVLMTQPMVPPGPNIVASVVVVTFPPSSPQPYPHYHSGAGIGYVLEGEFLFQINDEPHRVLPAGTAFYEMDGATHVWGGNASNTTTCRIVVTIFGRPGVNTATYLKDYPRETKEEALALAAKGL